MRGLRTLTPATTNATLAFGSETSNGAEIGYKAVPWNRRPDADLSAYSHPSNKLHYLYATDKPRTGAGQIMLWVSGPGPSNYK